ncbi:MAG: hypothetical protein PHI79_03415 [Sulfurovaceae bacterium]|nr:hypothetical protein [Sulfurovaceae bacterium]MDD5548630.1 hypothetical protein [Sulfurovaceae bacterium]
MTRVNGVIPLAAGKMATFQLCDRYGNVIPGFDIEAEVQAGCYFTAKMLDTCDDRVYKVLTDIGAICFEVHKRTDDKPYIVDLFSTSSIQKKYISFNDPYDRNILENVISTINRYNNGDEIFSVEEKAIICALKSDDNQDKLIELIKNNIGTTTQILDKVLVPIDGQCQEPMTLYLDSGNTAQGKIDFPFINPGSFIFKNSFHDLSSYVVFTTNIPAGTMQGTYSIPADIVNTSLNGVYELGFNNGGIIQTSPIRIEVC